MFAAQPDPARDEQDRHRGLSHFHHPGQVGAGHTGHEVIGHL
jgi:hypothetical protein